MSDDTPLRMSKKLPVSMRNDFWTALIDATELEVIRLRTKAEEKKLFYNVTYSEYDRILELASLFYNTDTGYLKVLTSALTADFGYTQSQVLEYLKAEILDLPYRLKNKTTLKYYQSVFAFFIFRLDYEIALYSVRTPPGGGQQYLSRELTAPTFSIEETLFIDDLSEPMEDSAYLLGYNQATPYISRQQTPGTYYGITSGELSLDSDQASTLDLLVTGSLDLTTAELKTTTKHISFESVLNQLITKSDGLQYLMTTEIESYIYALIYYYRQVSEVPHIGMQLTVAIDKSGVFDSMSDESIIDLHINCFQNPTYAQALTEVSELSYIKFGTGKHLVASMPSKLVSPLVYPEDLAATFSLAQVTILPDEKYEEENFWRVLAEYTGQSITGLLLHSVDGFLLGTIGCVGAGAFNGLNKVFTGKLPVSGEYTMVPIISKSVKFRVRNTVDPFDEVTISDDNNGALISDTMSGTINYSTGAYFLTSEFTSKRSVTLDTTVVDTVWSPTPMGSDEAFVDGSVSVSFVLTVNRLINGEMTPVSVKYYAVDSGDSTLGHTNCGYITSSVVTHETGAISITFSEICTLSDITLAYNHEVDIAYPDTYVLEIEQLYNGCTSVYITEAGLFDENDHMVSYMSFPKIELASNKFHVNIGFLLER